MPRLFVKIIVMVGYLDLHKDIFQYFENQRSKRKLCIIHCCCLFSCSVMSDSLQPHGLQHTRLSCPSLSPRVCSISCPLNQWCHSTISSSAIPFFSCLQSFPASEFFPMSQLLHCSKATKLSWPSCYRILILRKFLLKLAL